MNTINIATTILISINLFLIVKLFNYTKILFYNIVNVNHPEIKEYIVNNELYNLQNQNLKEFRLILYKFVPMSLMSLINLIYLIFNPQPTTFILFSSVFIIATSFTIIINKHTTPLWLINWTNILNTQHITIQNNIIQNQLKQIQIDIQQPNLPQQQINHLYNLSQSLQNQANSLHTEIIENNKISELLNKSDKL